MFYFRDGSITHFCSCWSAAYPPCREFVSTEITATAVPSRVPATIPLVLGHCYVTMFPGCLLIDLTPRAVQFRARGGNERTKAMNSGDKIWLAAARDLYVDTAARSMEWVLGRPRLHGAFLNTKMSSITLRDYTSQDGWRAPEFLYGWIQGRGLEALLGHADFFDTTAPDLAARLRQAARQLYPALADLYARHGRAYFYYDNNLDPVRPGSDGAAEPQSGTGNFHSFADIFVLKGLLTAAAQFDPPACEAYLAGLQRVMQSVEQGRFAGDEKQPFQVQDAMHYAQDYGPYMIMLGAASLLRRLGFHDTASFGDDIIAHVLSHYVDTDTGALPDLPGQDACNPGHAIEFAGFGLEYLSDDADSGLVARIEQVLLKSCSLGFSGPGIVLSASLGSGAPTSGHYPWWALPEAIRAAAVAYRRTANPASLAAWRRAHEDFYNNFWRGDPPVAYHTMSREGPVDYVPATPDLDPGYHTCLSLLGAVASIDGLLAG